MWEHDQDKALYNEKKKGTRVLIDRVECMRVLGGELSPIVEELVM